MSLYMQNMHGKRVQELLSEIQCLEKYRFKFYQQAQILEELRFENCFNGAHGCNCKILQPLSAWPSEGDYDSMGFPDALCKIYSS